MSFSNLGELKTSIGSWLRRPELVSLAGDLIALAEGQMNRRLRAPAMISHAIALVDDEYEGVPPDFLQMKSFAFPEGGLFVCSADQIAAYAAAAPRKGRPQYVAVVGEQLRFYPAPDGDYTGDLHYYAAITPLSDAAPTNWLLKRHPDAYLYGSLLQANLYLKNDARVPLWTSLYEAALADIERAARAGEFGPRLNPTPSIPAI